ncbi:uracil-DNA glycosylase family protein [Amaricoccus macauensis]|uniref:uracil-DNA glycosylase family protein n=1 Tax=Amaricoccus macauensis TaxID=57001 RepID=UPI003C7E34B6
MTAEELSAEIQHCRICADRFAATRTAHSPRPVPWLSETASILICGQAPGLKVHQKGRPFDDASGDRLRQWMGIDRDTFYDRSRIAVLPMAFCFPGYDAHGSDLPPPAICAQTWRKRVLGSMPAIQLTLLVGAYAQKWHLGGKSRSVSQTVADWRELPQHFIPLPHPSWRNTGWLKRNPWFEKELVPVLQARVCNLLQHR